MSTVGEIADLVHRRYPPETAESWDRVGLVCGSRDVTVTSVLLCVDVTRAVVARAREVGAQLIIAHHPLLLKGVHDVDPATPKGAILTELIRADIALLCAHTNADVADDGVSVALARALGLGELRELADGGLGRIGTLSPPMRLADFAARVADALPATVSGVRVAGDPDRSIATVAVLGGAGDSHLDLARSVGVDVYVTSDLRHHPAAEFREHAGAPALIDVSHWAAEWTWLPVLAEVIAAETDAEPVVCELRTDAWDFAVHPRVNA